MPTMKELREAVNAEAKERVEAARAEIEAVCKKHSVALDAVPQIMEGRIIATPVLRAIEPKE